MSEKYHQKHGNTKLSFNCLWEKNICIYGHDKNIIIVMGNIVLSESVENSRGRLGRLVRYGLFWLGFSPIEVAQPVGSIPEGRISKDQYFLLADLEEFSPSNNGERLSEALSTEVKLRNTTEGSSQIESNTQSVSSAIETHLNYVERASLIPESIVDPEHPDNSIETCNGSLKVVGPPIKRSSEPYSFISPEAPQRTNSESNWKSSPSKTPEATMNLFGDLPSTEKPGYLTERPVSPQTDSYMTCQHLYQHDEADHLTLSFLNSDLLSDIHDSLNRLSSEDEKSVDSSTTESRASREAFSEDFFSIENPVGEESNVSCTRYDSAEVVLNLNDILLGTTATAYVSTNEKSPDKKAPILASSFLLFWDNPDATDRSAVVIAKSDILQSLDNNEDVRTESSFEAAFGKSSNCISSHNRGIKMTAQQAEQTKTALLQYSYYRSRIDEKLSRIYQNSDSNLTLKPLVKLGPRLQDSYNFPDYLSVPFHVESASL